MSRKAFEKIKAGLEDARAWAEGDKSRGRAIIVTPSEIRDIRAGLGLSQQGFADLMHVSLRTLQNWEQGRRTPDGPARALLTVAAQEPKAVKRALAVTGE